MKTGKLIDLEEIIREREAVVIQECSCTGEIGRVNKIVLRRMWREKKRLSQGDINKEYMKAKGVRSCLRNEAKLNLNRRRNDTRGGVNMAKKSKHELGPVTNEELREAGGSLEEVYRRRAQAGDVGAKETMHRIARGEREAQRKAQAAATQAEQAERQAARKRLEERAKKPGTSVFHLRTKVINETKER